MFFKDFLMRTIFKVFMTVLLLSFMIWSLGAKACAILVLQPGIEPAATALEGEILTPGAPGLTDWSSQNSFDYITHQLQNLP